LESSVGEKQKPKPKTVGEVVAERANDPRRWKASEDDPAETLDPTFTDEAVEADNTHRFEAMVDEVARRDGVSRPAAFRRARQQYPTLFRDYVASGGPAASKSYSDLVEAEVRKGCSPTVASQRIAYAFPQAARESRESIAKSARVSEFMSAVDEIKKREGVSRVEAMARARRENPEAFERFQNVV
jgi:hypothetical protein